MMTTSVRTKKLPSLDGWRAVSIALVLVCHSTFTAGFPMDAKNPIFHWLEFVGVWGVRFFFVISGFLITHLLLQEHAKYSRISLKNFYIRRAIRILPVCFFYLFVLGCFTHFTQPVILWLANVTFTSNFFHFHHPNPAGHLWSLGVEEQFYLLWPCLLVLILHRPGAIFRLTKILILPLILAPTMRLLSYEHIYPTALAPLFYDGSFFIKFDSLAYGCLTAIAFNHAREPLERFCQIRFLPGLTGIGFVLLPLILPFHGRFQSFIDSLQAIGFSLLLLQSVLQPQRGLNRCLNWRWVSYIGVLSYSIYIWQAMFCVPGEIVFGNPHAWWVAFPVWMLVTLIVSAGSYHLLEKPLLNLRAKFHPA